MPVPSRIKTSPPCREGAPSGSCSSVAQPYGKARHGPLAADNRAIGLSFGAMVFNNKGKFFLNLDEKTPAAPAKVAPIAAAPAKDTKKAPAKQEAAVAATTTTANAKAESSGKAAPSGKVVTTAEAIAAELAAEQAARPARSESTFAPECVSSGGALPMRRRRGGANLAGFRSMASGLFGKK
ncbi:MAG: hypothetical protein ACKOHJ_06150 [Vulcanococcus sp.]